jgi:stalled ribosome rescue protein Dom34
LAKNQIKQFKTKALRVAGGVVNSAIVVAAANGIVSSKDASLLVSHGGNISINKHWAKSLLGRMKYVKRKCSNAGKVSLSNF